MVGGDESFVSITVFKSALRPFQPLTELLIRVTAVRSVKLTIHPIIAKVKNEWSHTLTPLHSFTNSTICFKVCCVFQTGSEQVCCLQSECDLKCTNSIASSNAMNFAMRSECESLDT